MSDEPAVSNSLLIVVGQALVGPWLRISMEGQFPTWLKDARDLGIPVRHSHGRKSGVLVQALDRCHEWLRWRGRGRTLIPKLDESLGKAWLGLDPRVETCRFGSSGAVAWRQSLVDIYALQRWKVIGSLRQSLTEDYSHLYLTTASSYVRVHELLAHAQALPSSGLYAGTPVSEPQFGIRFASGANRMLSRDVVEAVIREKQRYRNDVLEDVGLGRLVSEMGISVTPLPSMNVSTVEAVSTLTDTEILTNFHFRTTSSDRKNRNDAEVMRRLHSRVIVLEREHGMRHAGH